MKNLPVVFSSLALVGVIVLFILFFNKPKQGASRQKTTTTATSAQATGLKIAYVNIDSFEANYQFLKDKRDAFSKRQDAMRRELQSGAQKLQNAVAAFQQKAQGGTMTQAEAEAEQKRLGQMDQDLQAKSARMEEQLLKEQQDFNDKLRKMLDEFLAEYNEDNRYDYILSYSAASPFLYVNPEMDITDDVLAGMNARNGKLKSEVK